MDTQKHPKTHKTFQYSNFNGKWYSYLRNTLTILLSLIFLWTVKKVKALFKTIITRSKTINLVTRQSECNKVLI